MEKKNSTGLGFTGVGKTSFLEYMFGAQQPQQSHVRPTAGAHRYIFEIDDTKFKAVDTPGHPTFANLLDQEIDSLVRGGYQGVINIVAYGYSEPRHGRLLDRVDNPYAPVFRNGRPNPRYLARTRALEIEYMKAWASLLTAGTKLKWILTVVNKADLWMSNRGAVLEHYGEPGEYGRVIKRLIGQIPHDVTPMVSVADGGFFSSERRKKPDLEWRHRIRNSFARILLKRLSEEI